MKYKLIGRKWVKQDWTNRLGLYMKTCFLRTSRCTTPTPNYLLNSIVFADNANNPWRFVRQAPANSGAQTPYCRLRLIRFIKLLYKVIVLCSSCSKKDLQISLKFFTLIDNTRRTERILLFS